MLIDTSAILLNLLNIALIGLFTATLLLCSLAPFAARRAIQLSAGARQGVLWSFVAAPWLVGILCALLFFTVPSRIRKCDLAGPPGALAPPLCVLS
ncbi:hypothetical protein [Congregibacter litoralis]|uniref:Uncharacterized protein n=1 Tax=Congregibacter litoralis KT71 TaxID=314285 RepID=V7HSA7_9GAMM|nr:hypothetical protein [Congregibacter litoralis]ESZ89438.1 hypothetical protein KT71_002438 [Congregibacter litoralis KT71]